LIHRIHGNGLDETFKEDDIEPQYNSEDQ